MKKKNDTFIDALKKGEERLNDNTLFKRDLSWNIAPCLRGKFDEHYISYSIHELVEHTCWSLSDILRINYLWTELQVWHQNFEDM
jgi:hypothetical protein